MGGAPGAPVSQRAGADGPARSDTVRRHNLGRLLVEVHRDGELSRADLTGRLGLNRSTIGTLVGELVAGGLLRGGVPDVTARSDLSAGRPSHVVGRRADGPFVLAVDLEVDRAAVAAVGLCGVVLTRREVSPVGTTPADVARTVARNIAGIIDETPGFAVGIGVSVPGSVERDTGNVALAPNLAWHDVPFGPLLRDAVRAAGAPPLPVGVGNDANLGAVAEHVRGHARGHDDVVFLLGRIGVGAGIIAGGRLLTGFAGGAGEVGHLCLSTDGPPCHCGSHGCAEVYIGDAALLAAAGRPAPAARSEVADVLEAAAAGHPRELAAVREVATYLGRTIAATLNLVNPSVVIAGGTLARVLEIAGECTRSELDRYAFGRAGTQLLLQASSNQAGEACLLGAAELAFEPLLADPAAYALPVAVPVAAN